MLGTVVIEGSIPIGVIGVGATNVGVTVIGMIGFGVTSVGLIFVGVIVVGMIGVGVAGKPGPGGNLLPGSKLADTGIRGLPRARPKPINPKMRPKIDGTNCDPDGSNGLRPPPPNNPPLLPTLMVFVKAKTGSHLPDGCDVTAQMPLLIRQKMEMGVQT